ncbi:flavodoxin family protein [Metallumcola ferriviriculae]|uniref:Flavodoxin family protein n=1 Tax=Metallumcola ferriviriculae TaxID=3039180 RepID=A0AAU0USC8_9FIRM|nr:flavodoxin family protein [Desulfitibacteraceae bacterium MK1]
MGKSKKIVGISSGREGGITDKAVKKILEASQLPYDFISLSSFELLTCNACNGCVTTYQCVKDDQLNEICDIMQQADGIVFGAPEYWNGANGKARVFWERICFSTRHNAQFPLAGTPGIIVGVSGDGDSREVLQDIRVFFEDARIKLIDSIEVQGEYACFTCGYGENCEVGGLADIYELPTIINDKTTPSLCNQYPHKLQPGKDITKQLTRLGKALANRFSANQPDI